MTDWINGTFLLVSYFKMRVKFSTVQKIGFKKVKKKQGKSGGIHIH